MVYVGVFLEYGTIGTTMLAILGFLGFMIVYGICEFGPLPMAILGMVFMLCGAGGVYLHL